MSYLLILVLYSGNVLMNNVVVTELSSMKVCQTALAEAKKHDGVRSESKCIEVSK